MLNTERRKKLQDLRKAVSRAEIALATAIDSGTDMRIMLQYDAGQLTFAIDLRVG